MACFSPSHRFHLDYRTYQRPFARPLQAAWGTWAIREGVLLRLENPDDGTTGFGEIAPLPAFGSETLEAALAFIRSVPEEPTLEALLEAMKTAPSATAFGLWSAMTGLSGTGYRKPPRSAALLSLETDTATELPPLRSMGIHTFKLKLGIGPMEAEWDRIRGLVAALEEGEQLRLDPNQSWDAASAAFWFARLGEVAGSIEFIEEPYREGLLSIKAMTAEARQSPVPLAIDESLSRDGVDKWLQAGWPGYWILKPSIMGIPDPWRESLQGVRDRVVLSSVFETGIGLHTLARLASELNDRVHGLGTEAWFNDGFGTAGASVPVWQQEEQIWNRLSEG